MEFVVKKIRKSTVLTEEEETEEYTYELEEEAEDFSSIKKITVKAIDRFAELGDKFTFKMRETQGKLGKEKSQ